MSVHSLPKLTKYYIYALQCQDVDGPGYIKFGRTMNVTRRLSQLRVTCPIPAHYYAFVVMPSYRKCLEVEKALHRQFSERRTKGEWFRFNFSSLLDKQEFNEGCREVFNLRLDKPQWWEKVDIKAYDKNEAKRRKEFMASRNKNKIISYEKNQAKSRAAWKELDSYGVK